MDAAFLETSSVAFALHHHHHRAAQKWVHPRLRQKCLAKGCSEASYPQVRAQRFDYAKSGESTLTAKFRSGFLLSLPSLKAS